MPIPFLLIGAIVAGAAGVGTGIRGAVKMKGANDTIKTAKEIHNDAIDKYNEYNDKATKTMDKLGIFEMEILKSFDEFNDLFEKIHNRPEMDTINIEGLSLPKYSPEELKEVSVAANAVLGGLGGAAAGTAGGIAAAGATTAAVMALGTASTGTAIATLSGAAATNATLAAIGGGSLAAGGLGVAGGTAILTGATAGVGLLVGGIIFNVVGGRLSEKAEDAFDQAMETEETVNKICKYLGKLNSTATKYNKTLKTVNKLYTEYLGKMRLMICTFKKTDWNKYNSDEKLIVENTGLLVFLLYNMCKVQIVKKDADNDGYNEINRADIDTSMNNAKVLLADSRFSTDSAMAINEINAADKEADEEESFNNSSTGMARIRVGRF